MYTENLDMVRWKENKVSSKGYSRLLTAVWTGYYPYMSFKKMSNLRLESFVTKLIHRSVHEFHQNRKKTRPKWWPKYLQFVIPIRKLKTTINRKNWASTLRDVIASCSEFYKISILNTVPPHTNYLKTPGNDILESLEPVGRKEYWLYRCYPNNRAVLKKKKELDVNYNTLSSIINLHLGKLLPFVKLCDIAKDSKLLLQTFKVPTVRLVDVLEYPINLKTGRRKTFPAKLTDLFPTLKSKFAHVRLTNIFDQPEDVQYTKDDFMKYFNLGSASDTNHHKLMTRAKPIASRILRNNNIPISSDLGRCVCQSSSQATVACQTSWKIQRLEWYLKEVPQVKSDKKYVMSYEDRKLESPHSHKYKFPKRQNYQTRQTLRLHSQLKKCRPVCVKLEHMDFSKIN